MRSLRRGVVPLVESAWLLGIARNVCRERWEVAGRRNRVESTCDPQELDRASVAPEGRRDELIGLEEALTRLPDQQRRAILLRDWRGLSYDEVAAQLGVSRAAVETLIFRGRRTLAELLREEPRETKRRLAALGNLGSIFSAIKTAFTGAAAATKIAAAVSVTAIAVGGAGVAVTAPAAPAPSKPSVVRTPAPAPAPVAASPHTSSAPTTHDLGQPKRSVPAPAAKRTPVTRAAAPTRSATTEHPTTPVTALPTPTAHSDTPAAAAPKVAATTPVKALVGAVPVQTPEAPPLTGPVETLVQSEIVQTVVAPVVGTVVDTVEPVTAPVVAIVSDVVPPLPPVTVTPPPILGLPPVTVTPPKLLP